MSFVLANSVSIPWLLPQNKVAGIKRVNGCGISACSVCSKPDLCSAASGLHTAAYDLCSLSGAASPLANSGPHPLW